MTVTGVGTSCGDITVARTTRSIGLTVSLLAFPGCFDVNLFDDMSLLPTQATFVLTGTATLLDNDGPCLAWVGENGVTYHLFQNARIENDVFDRITTPGVTSRIEITTRNDIPLECATGQVAEVQRVLEIWD